MPGSPRDGSTHPSCIASCGREEFASRIPRSVGISRDAWGGLARHVPV
jgi:hypothetical protein